MLSSSSSKSSWLKQGGGVLQQQQPFSLFRTSGRHADAVWQQKRREERDMVETDSRRDPWLWRSALHLWPLFLRQLQRGLHSGKQNVAAELMCVWERERQLDWMPPPSAADLKLKEREKMGGILGGKGRAGKMGWQVMWVFLSVFVEGAARSHK